MDKPVRTSKQKNLTESPTSQLTQQQIAAYIGDVALGLRTLADRADLPFLTYLLDMAVHESMQQSELPRRRRGDRR